VVLRWWWAVGSICAMKVDAGPEPVPPALKRKGRGAAARFEV